MGRETRIRAAQLRVTTKTTRVRAAQLRVTTKTTRVRAAQLRATTKTTRARAAQLRVTTRTTRARAMTRVPVLAPRPLVFFLRSPLQALSRLHIFTLPSEWLK